MNAFHVYWTALKTERNFNDYFILTLILSVLQWKQNQKDKIKFYGDKMTVEFLKNHNLLHLWDEYDDYTLDHCIDYTLYDVSIFYPIGKFYAYKNEENPCAMIDVDLILWENIDHVLYGKDVVFTHWEDSQKTSPWYCGKNDLHTARDYTFNKLWNFKTRAANTSFVYFNHKELKEYYIESALNYMKNNHIDRKVKLGNPELLFVEQRLLTMCIDELNLWDRTTTLVDITWDAKLGKFIKFNKKSGGWDFFNPDNKNIVTHTWIAKEAIEHNVLFRDYLCCRLIEMILDINGDMRSILGDMKVLDKYLLMLSKYESTEVMLKKNIVTNLLYS